MKSPVRWLSDEAYRKAGFATRALAWAASQVGVRETGRNKGEMVEAYQEQAGLGKGGGYPWCAAFVYWAYIKAGTPPNRLPNFGAAAAVRNWRDWAAKNDRLTDKPQRGDLFYWVGANGQGHIGFVTEVSILGFVKTIEGNTNDGGSRDGDGVYRRTRLFASIRKLNQGNRFCFIRMTTLLTGVR